VILTFALSLGCGLVLSSIAIQVGRRFGWVVRPRLFGRGGSEISYLGGVALAVSSGLAIAVAGGLGPRGQIVLAGGFVLLIFGLADDRLPGGGLSPVLRLLVEVVVALAVSSTVLRPALIGIGFLDLLLSVFVLVAASNAFNLLDNMDGVAGATAAAVAVGLIGLGILQGQPVVSIFGASLLGACISFLRHNFRGGRLYLGNGGSLFLGFLLAAWALHLQFPIAKPWGLFAVIALLAIPATDTTLVVLSRMAAHRPVLEGGVDHLSHRLTRLGLSAHGAALVHAAGCGLGAAAAVFAVEAETIGPLVAVILWFGVSMLAFMSMSVYEIQAEPRLLVPTGGSDHSHSASQMAEEGTA
jgi:UDP-GlcNAc:undecaprenyl-phosphate GlcNAc-1-phosphate transferase